MPTPTNPSPSPKPLYIDDGYTKAYTTARNDIIRGAIDSTAKNPNKKGTAAWSGWSDGKYDGLVRRGCIPKGEAPWKELETTTEESAPAPCEHRDEDEQSTQ